MGDVNKTTHVGTAVTNPSFANLSSSTLVVIFTLKVREVWKDRKGNKRHKDNLFKIEVLGKNALWAKEKVKAGKRYHIDGYLRSDNIHNAEEVKIRVFNITEEDEGLFQDGKREGMKEGFNRAMALMENSDTLDTATAKVGLLLEES